MTSPEPPTSSGLAVPPENSWKMTRKPLAITLASTLSRPAMRHAVDDLAHAELAAIFDDRFQRGNHRFAAVEAEALGADIFAAQELLILFGLDDLGQDRLLPVLGEDDFLVLAFHALLQEAALLHISDVHIFEADIAAVIGAQNVHDLADRGPFKTKRTADIDLPVEIRAREAVIFRRQVRRQVALDEAERIEIGRQMPADAIGADEHHRTDGIARRLRDVRFGQRGAALCARSLDGELHLRGIERGGQIVRRIERPALPGPARTLLDLALASEILILKTHGRNPRFATSSTA
ncbi:hypothetical protein HNP60_000036 [Sphingobium sp. B1D3A]|uniref:Uncharacterized protein n=1 Tax=Sphingobium lignivorans TaxID=2735886 RepID=A0ABR6N9X0_9SPHN|nr:hypothetical protein [Sphingobium lignivorans]